MSIDQADVTRALEILGEGARLDVAGERSDWLRYADSAVTAQHSEQRLRVRVRITRGGRVVAGTLETLDADAVRALAGRLSGALAELPPQPATASSVPAVDRAAACHQVAVAGPAVDADLRHEWFRKVRAGLDGEAVLGGSIRYEIVDRVVADSDGLLRAETLKKASLQAIAKQDGRSVYVRHIRRDPGEIPVDEVADRLRAALVPLPTRDAHHGPARVLLTPQAALPLIATYGYVALGANAYALGRSAVSGRLGEQVVSDRVTLSDDAADPAGLPSGFDAEGNVRRRTSLIENGVLTGVVSDTRRAGLTGGVPTGHATPDGWRFGADPVPSHLVMAAGDATEQDLLAGCGTGLVVNRLDYLRTLHPKDTLVTGTTRDGTYWVEDGRIVAWHPQVRLTFRMDEALNAVLAVGRDRECGEQPFIESVVIPSMVIDAGPIVLP